MKIGLFDRIAKYYGLFFLYQKRKYNPVLERINNELGLYLHRDILDIGCGTGALCSELRERGFRVTGVDSSSKMLEVAREKLKDEEIDLVEADFLSGLPFEDKSVDVAFTSFVAHGLQPEERKVLYREMYRITKHLIIIYDYNERRSVLTNIIEWLEGGDYFSFIKTVKVELKECFHDIQELDLGEHASCYVIRV